MTFKPSKRKDIEEAIAEAGDALRNDNGYSAFWERGTAPSLVRRLREKYDEPHRFYHTWDHALEVVDRVLYLANEADLNSQQRNMLVIAACFHDYVYDPTQSDNEELSAREVYHHWMRPGGATFIEKTIEEIQTCILETKTHKPTKELSKILCAADMSIVAEDQGFAKLLRYEQGIFKEYQWTDYGVYKALRSNMLRKWAEEFPANAKNLYALAEYVENRRPRVGVIPGSFDPFHKGHLNIVEKAEKLFDKVIVAQGVNPLKPPKNEDHDITKIKALRFRQTERFTGLLPTYVNEKSEHSEVTLVRGLRNGDDLAYEVNQLRFIEDFDSTITNIFIHCDREFEHLSSSMVRSFEQIAPVAAEKYKV
jgi:pantetheine-phosphate adenylyltransferase